MNSPVWHEPAITRADRWSLHNLFGMTVWLTGLSGSGKSTIANEAARHLHRAGILTYVLDADNVRHRLNADLGFDHSDRVENIRRMAELAHICSDAGLLTFVPIISPFAQSRAHARQIHADDDLTFIEVYVATPLEECERRDPKGMYAKVRSGQLTGLTGIDAPYEAPQLPDVVIGAHGDSLEASTQTLIDAIIARRKLKQ
ncbi:MAG: adenylyl-sulfate kinase [Ilumatobacteraceae bacterium]